MADEAKLPCIQCGNCCRHATVCDLYPWRSREAWNAQDNHFDPPCPELREDGRCDVMVKAFAGELNVSDAGMKWLRKYLTCVCDSMKYRAMKDGTDGKR